MHCFAGDIDDARFYLEMGLHISFTANVTYKNFDRSVVAYVPLDRLMIETDSPYIAPAPLRKQRNEPANVVAAARAMAEIHRVSVESFARITTANARRFFGLPAPG
jgi:TatD DNase family protein